MTHRTCYSQSTSRVTSICENEMTIRIPLCNVQHLNQMLNIFSGNLSEKDVLTGKKIQNTQAEQLLFLKYLRL